MRTGLVPSLSALAVAAMFLVSSPASAQIALPTHLSVPSNANFLTAGMTTKATESAAATQSSGGSSGGVGFGIKGGWLYNSFDSAHESLDSTNGWEAGIFFGGNRNGVVGVMGELLYAKKTIQPLKTSTPTDIYFLEIPVLMRINIGSSNINKGAIFYVLVGPVFDVNLKAKQADLDVKDNYESLNVGILGGGGLEISRFIVEARYNWGLMNLLNTSQFVDQELKNQSFAVLLGLRFN
jgi:hypothetical protein